MIIGILGLTLLAVGWLFEAIKIIKEKRSGIDIKFATLYSSGSLLLVIYSLQIKDIIFIMLNSLVLILSLISLFYTIKK